MGRKVEENQVVITDTKQDVNDIGVLTRLSLYSLSSALAKFGYLPGEVGVLVSVFDVKTGQVFEAYNDPRE